ncbi:MAG: GNAT family N-acetyltransferase [Bdellovibrio sp.]|nr:GNAT family N-acetyltransferase [Bdellovibrio sp.]
MRVLRIHPKDTISIRQQMLRPGRPIESCIYTGDDDEQTFHLGAFVDTKLVSVASFYFEKHPQLSPPYQYRLRGMATLSEYQRRGLSSELLKMAFPIIKQNLASLLWCNARLTAVGFYEKVGFEKVSEPFTIPDIGEHILMTKKIEIE